MLSENGKECQRLASGRLLPHSQLLVGKGSCIVHAKVSVTTLDAHASKQAASAIHAVIRVARHAAIMIDAAM